MSIKAGIRPVPASEPNALFPDIPTCHPTAEEGATGIIGDIEASLSPDAPDPKPRKQESSQTMTQKARQPVVANFEDVDFAPIAVDSQSGSIPMFDAQGRPQDPGLQTFLQEGDERIFREQVDAGDYDDETEFLRRRNQSLLQEALYGVPEETLHRFRAHEADAQRREAAPRLGTVASPPPPQPKKAASFLSGVDVGELKTGQSTLTQSSQQEPKRQERQPLPALPENLPDNPFSPLHKRAQPSHSAESAGAWPVAVEPAPAEQTSQPAWSTQDQESDLPFTTPTETPKNMTHPGQQQGGFPPPSLPQQQPSSPSAGANFAWQDDAAPLPPSFEQQAPQPPTRPAQEEEGPDIYDLIVALRGPSRAAIEERKKQLGCELIAIPFSDTDIYLIKPLTSLQYRNMQASWERAGAEMTEHMRHEAIVKASLQWPTLSPTDYSTMKAGTISSLVEAILFASNFIPTQLLMSMAIRL